MIIKCFDKKEPVVSLPLDTHLISMCFDSIDERADHHCWDSSIKKTGKIPEDDCEEVSCSLVERKHHRIAFGQYECGPWAEARETGAIKERNDYKEWIAKSRAQRASRNWPKPGAWQNEILVDFWTVEDGREVLCNSVKDTSNWYIKKGPATSTDAVTKRADYQQARAARLQNTINNPPEYKFKKSKWYDLTGDIIRDAALRQVCVAEVYQQEAHGIRPRHLLHPA